MGSIGTLSSDGGSTRASASTLKSWKGKINNASTSDEMYDVMMSLKDKRDKQAEYSEAWDQYNELYRQAERDWYELRKQRN